MKKCSIWLLAAAMVCCACESRQTTQDEFQSTVVNADGTVTFSYCNPNAKEVMVDVQFAGRHAMQLDSASNVWTVTLGPAAPDMYPYCFIVDGVSVMDPCNQQYFPNEGFKNSLLDIPGTDQPLIHSIQNVPHGNVEYVKYYSSAIGAYNNAIVYTPPTYNNEVGANNNEDGKSNDDELKRYPVFYLISGTTDTEEVYYKVGRVNYILDNLIHQGEAQEMIVVLPYGNPAKLINAPMQMGPGGARDYFSNDLVNDLMPYIESHYRTIADRDHRAIGGFSRGGNQGLMNGLTNLDKFSYLCSYSSFTTTALPGVYDNADDTNSKIHLFWAGVGTDDFLYGNARDYTEFLDQKGVRCVKEYTDDKFGHTWMNAKYFLAKTLRLLFNEEASEAAMLAAQPTKPKTGEEKQFTPGVMARLFPKPLVSPEAKGGDVTFRCKAEAAEKVLLECDCAAEPVVMERDSDGVWSATLSDVAPNVYCYNFVVDGTQVADAQNMYLAPDRGFKRSVLDIAATPDVRLEYTPVQYRADNLPDGTQRHYAVVRPCDGPIVALVAGGRDTFESWHKIAKANVILDQMLAANQCKPCVLYMTESAVPGAAITLNSADYKTWGEARAALVEALKRL